MVVAGQPARVLQTSTINKKNISLNRNLNMFIKGIPPGGLKPIE
jgi:hypothetical protein